MNSVFDNIDSILKELEVKLEEIDKKISMIPYDGCDLIKISEDSRSKKLNAPFRPQYIIKYYKDEIKISYWFPKKSKMKLSFLKEKELEENFEENFKQTLNLHKNREATDSDLEAIALYTGHTTEIKRKKSYFIPLVECKKNDLKNINFRSHPFAHLEHEIQKKDLQSVINFIQTIKQAQSNHLDIDALKNVKDLILNFFQNREEIFYNSSSSLFNLNYKPNQLYIKLLNLTEEKNNRFQNIEKILPQNIQLRTLVIKNQDPKTKFLTFDLKAFDQSDIAKLKQEEQLSILEDNILFEDILIPASYLVKLNPRNILNLAGFFKAQGILEEFRLVLLAHPKLQNLGYTLYKYNEFKSFHQTISELIREMNKHGTKYLNEFEYTEPPASFYHHWTTFHTYLDNLPEKLKSDLMKLPSSYTLNFQRTIDIFFSQQDKCIDRMLSEFENFLKLNEKQKILHEVPQYIERDLAREIIETPKGLTHSTALPIYYPTKLPPQILEEVLKDYVDQTEVLLSIHASKTLDYKETGSLLRIINFFINFHPDNYPQITDYFFNKLELSNTKLTMCYAEEIVGLLPFKNQKMQFLKVLVNYKKNKSLTGQINYREGRNTVNYYEIKFETFLNRTYQEAFGTKIEFIKFLNILDQIQTDQVTYILEFLSDEKQKIEFLKLIFQGNMGHLKYPKFQEMLTNTNNAQIFEQILLLTSENKTSFQAITDYPFLYLNNSNQQSERLNSIGDLQTKETIKAKSDKSKVVQRDSDPIISVKKENIIENIIENSRIKENSSSHQDLPSKKMNADLLEPAKEINLKNQADKFFLRQKNQIAIKKLIPLKIEPEKNEIPPSKSIEILTPSQKIYIDEIEKRIKMGEHYIIYLNAQFAHCNNKLPQEIQHQSLEYLATVTDNHFESSQKHRNSLQEINVIALKYQAMKLLNGELESLKNIIKNNTSDKSNKELFLASMKKLRKVMNEDNTYTPLKEHRNCKFEHKAIQSILAITLIVPIVRVGMNFFSGRGINYFKTVGERNTNNMLNENQNDLQKQENMIAKHRSTC